MRELLSSHRALGKIRANDSAVEPKNARILVELAHGFPRFKIKAW